MSLDLHRVAAQVSRMIEGLRNSRDEREKHLRRALETIGSEAIDLDELKRKIASARTSWLVAELVEKLDNRYPAPPTPPRFTVLATDGSHIDIDRHRSARCYLINTGSVVISYGPQPAARLESSPRLYSDDEDMVISAPGNSGREQVIEGALLGVKRAVEECRRLTELASELPPGSRALALLDGTLILWGLSTDNYPDFVGDVLLNGGLLQCLDEMKKLTADRRLALASYISFPRSTDVVNVLKVALCPLSSPNCDQCPNEKERECEEVSGVRDRDLFMELLGKGERSALFISPSKIVKERYGEHKVFFFYLKTDDEIARVELPQWVAEDPDLLNLTHSLILDQCRRGQGYPVALSEAHEQAVVTGADRENFWELVESSMAAEHMPVPASAKSLSKRTRWV